MENLLEFMTQYAIFPIALICFFAGYVIKNFIPKLPNKFIPLILAVLGLFLNLVFNNFVFSFDIIVAGIASGLVATGSFEMVRNLLNKEPAKISEITNVTVTEKKEETK